MKKILSHLLRSRPVIQQFLTYQDDLGVDKLWHRKEIFKRRARAEGRKNNHNLKLICRIFSDSQRRCFCLRSFGNLTFALSQLEKEKEGKHQSVHTLAVLWGILTISRLKVFKSGGHDVFCTVPSPKCQR